MGKELLEIILDDASIRLIGACTRQSSAWIGKDVGAFVGRPDVGVRFANSIAGIVGQEKATKTVLIDFSTPEALLEHLESAVHLGLPILVGTSGVQHRYQTALKRASSQVPVLVAPSTSIVANLVAMLSGIAAQVLKDADIEISEMHHRQKKDSPSGTAYFLADYIAKSRSATLSDVACFNRYEAGPRKPNEIGVFGMRGGSVAGTHTVHFLGEDETLEIVHRTNDRRTFAAGAITAARFLAEQPAGLYNMLDVFKMPTSSKRDFEK
jgi:4-hydroxy-tetrahydrodipicolinate reductase